MLDLKTRWDDLHRGDIYMNPLISFKFTFHRTRNKLSYQVSYLYGILKILFQLKQESLKTA